MGTQSRGTDIDRAIVDNYVGGWGAITRGLGVRMPVLEDRVPHFLTGLPIMMYNGLFDGRLDGPDEVDRIVDEFMERRLPMMWFVGPDASPELPAWLESRLEEATMQVPGMALRLGRLDTSGLEATVSRGEIDIRDASPYRDTYVSIFLDGFNLEAGDEDRLQDFARLYFDHPDAYHYVAFLRGEPAGIGTVLYHAGVAGIYDMVTLARHRRQGVARAVMSRLLLDAHVRGESSAILHATEMGHPLYRSMGFEDRFVFRRFLLRPFT